MQATELRGFLRRVRHRLMVIGGAASLCWALVLVGAVLLAGIWLDLLWDLSPSWRLAATLCAAMAGTGLLAWSIAKVSFAAEECRAARQLDRAAGSGGLIVSGWELARPAALPAASSSSELTAGLARMAVHQATQVAQTVLPSQAVSARPLRKAAGTLGALALATAAAALFMPTLTGTEINRFLNPFSDVPPYSTVRFAVSPGTISVVYGEQLDIQAMVTAGSAEQVELVVEDGLGQPETLPMFPQPGQQWRTTLTRVTQPATYFVRAERARSQRYRIEVVTVPRIDSVRFRVTPPAYTNEAPMEGPLPKEGLTGLPGTGVLVWAKSNRPLSGGVVALHCGGEPLSIPMQPTAPGSDEVTGALTIEAAGKFQLAVIDVGGQSSQDPFGGSLTLLEDQRPFVRLVSPRPLSLATPSASLPIAVAADDDYGIARVQLYRSLNDSRPLPLQWNIETPAPRHWQQQTILPLAEYGLSPGDEIKLFARVEDNDPSGAKGAESAVATVRIISQADFERMLRQREGLQALMSRYQAALRRIEKLQERIARLQKDLENADLESPVIDAMRDELKQLIQELQENARQIHESAEHPLPYDLDHALADQLKQLAGKLSDAAQSLEKSRSDAALTNQQLSEELQQIARRLAEGRQQYQQEAMVPLELLARVFPLLQDQSRFLVLARRQRDLSRRLQSLEGRNGEDDPALKARMRELEEEQRGLREELSELLDDIEDHVSQLPDDEMYDQLRDTATDFVEALRASEAADAMSAAEAGLAEFSGTRGYVEATRAADILEQFIGQCEGMAGSCRGCLAFNPSLGTCLGNTADQLLAEAGLGFGAGSAAGSGVGSGAGSGYSAQRGSANNVGLYGGLPGVDAAGMGDGSGGEDYRWGSAGAFGAPGASDQSLLFHTDTADRASGSSEGLIPTLYRQRVGQYFLRIAEEAGNNQ